MPTTVYFQTVDLERITAILNRRAAFMVKDLVVLGRHSADDYALAGGRHARGKGLPTRYAYLRRQGKRARMRKWHATGAQQARMIEHVSYKAFLDFFGPW